MSQPNRTVADTNRTPRSLAVALGGIALGVALIASAQQFPQGIGRLPGPGFFPMVLGALIVIFSSAAYFEGRPKSVSGETHQTSHAWWAPFATVVLLAAYLTSWEWIPFLVRTPLLVLLLMRLFGARWIPAAIAAIAFTAFLYGVFQLGLRVDLG